MKIALMTNNYKPIMGGVPISIERLAKGLRTLGHEVTIFAPTYEEQEEEENIFRYATCMKKFIGGIVLPNPFDMRIDQIFEKEQFDVIHVHHPMLIGRTAVYLSKKYQIPLVFTYHTRYEQYLSYLKGIQSLENMSEKNDGILSMYSKSILQLIQNKMMPAYLHTFLRHCDFVISPTKSIKDYLVTTCHVQNEKLGILPTGIESDKYVISDRQKELLRMKYQIKEETPVLLTIARLSHEKNIMFLLNSVAQIKQIYGENFVYFIVGDGPQKDCYQNKCQELGIEKQVIFTGTVENDQIPTFAAVADVFIFASKTETQGIVILEALAGATPVIALDATGVSDVVRDGYNGYLVAENEIMFAQKVVATLDNLQERELLSYHAIITASNYYEDAIARRALQFYNCVIAKKTLDEVQWKLESRI